MAPAVHASPALSKVRRGIGDRAPVGVILPIVGCRHRRSPNVLGVRFTKNWPARSRAAFPASRGDCRRLPYLLQYPMRLLNRRPRFLSTVVELSTGLRQICAQVFGESHLILMCDAKLVALFAGLAQAGAHLESRTS